MWKRSSVSDPLSVAVSNTLSATTLRSFLVPRTPRPPLVAKSSLIRSTVVRRFLNALSSAFATMSGGRSAAQSRSVRSGVVIGTVRTVADSTGRLVR